MPNPKLLAIVTAFMLVAGAPGAYATYTLSQLQIIEQFILDKDSAALRAFIGEHPELLEGDDQLAVELRIFMAKMDEGFWLGLNVAPEGLSPMFIENLKAAY